MNATPSKNLQVLLVDDDPDFANAVEELLKHSPDSSFNVVWKESIETALQEIERTQAFDIIVTDYTFSSSNGLDFCLQLNDRDLRIPIVFLTAVKDVELAVDAIKLGVEDFIMKDELSELTLGKTLINVVDRVHARKGMEAVARRMKLAESRSEAVKELVVTVCHEFNNPLAAIKISADLLKRIFTETEDKLILDQFEESFAKVEREIIRLRDMNFERLDRHIRPGS